MTTAVASISVTLEPDDNWTVVTVRRQDDLPAHCNTTAGIIVRHARFVVCEGSLVRTSVR